MSSLVDEAVFDYFSVLLTDVDELEEIKPVQVTNERNLLLSKESKVQKSVTDRFSADTVQSLKQTRPAPSKPTLTTEARLKNTEPQLDKQSLEQLLAPVFKPQVSAVKPEEKIKVKVNTEVNAQIREKAKLALNKRVKPKPAVEAEVKPLVNIVDETEIQIETLQQVDVTPPKVTKDLLETLDDEFQVLFFKVAGLTLAVPLVSLGGIVKLERVNHIMGRPSWYKGVQTYRDSQLNIVDTCAWVMPEKYDEALAETVNYQYVVLLEDSNWGLTCESLVNSVKINKSAVNWRSNAGKRPWLAGVVREQMCGILHVQALIELLNSGLGSQDPVG
ncbi:chemotaxis protein CheW [Shewanella eurypsychrophilus]|uniref:Chemotaxis protein CheW n=1 Tax=Shewanella eurypsychrophilus TaxID=2593656 RepID=A0ABX6VA34_9GAMM|nr:MULTISPECIES: chemotaxis protein CheW [Shewanella]QFU23467.1 chemotaxis protein CheW [Shewanella sp. YLB-09]QPG58695.1 chemotaxis protein CheW [Shewanella eurypsychrophilus]